MVWTESSTHGCDLERIWTHTLNGLADLTESEFAACEAGCENKDGAACVAAGLLIHSGLANRYDKSVARATFRRECQAKLFPGCVALWWTETYEDLAKDIEEGNIGARDRLELYCQQGERHACEALAMHFIKRLQKRRNWGDIEMTVAYLQAACGRGSLSACTDLGRFHVTGTGVLKDQKRGAALIEKQCQLGHAPACGMLGEVYDDGVGVVQDVAKATELYRMACEGGLLYACYRYGNKFWPLNPANTVNDPKDAEIAVKYFEKACQGGHQLGCLEAGQAYLFGQGVTEDHSRAMEYYETACNREMAAACQVLGDKYDQGDGVEQDSGRAAYYFSAGCTYGNARSCLNMGYYFLEGYGVAENILRASDCFAQACYRGESDGCYRLARIKAHGLDGEPDEYWALRNMERACSGDHREACDELEFYRHYQRFRPLDDEDTATIFLESCHHGSMSSCYELGLLYKSWDSSVIYHMNAAVVFQKACDGGLNEACSELGSAYMDGRGVDQDIPKGIKLIKDACYNHYGRACYDLALRYRDGDQVEQDDFKAILLLDDACLRLPEVCAEAQALRARYRAEREPEE